MPTALDVTIPSNIETFALVAAARAEATLAERARCLNAVAAMWDEQVTADDDVVDAALARTRALEAIGEDLASVVVSASPALPDVGMVAVGYQALKEFHGDDDSTATEVHLAEVVTVLAATHAPPAETESDLAIPAPPLRVTADTFALDIRSIIDPEARAA